MEENNLEIKTEEQDAEAPAVGKKQKMRKPIDSSRFPHYNGNRKE